MTDDAEELQSLLSKSLEQQAQAEQRAKDNVSDGPIDLSQSIKEHGKKKETATNASSLEAIEKSMQDAFDGQ